MRTVLSRKFASAIAFLVCALLSGTASAQVFNKLYHDQDIETAQSVRHTSDGGYITAGYIQFNWGWMPVMLKTDLNGVLQWSKVLYPNTNNYPQYPADVVFAVREITDPANPGYILVGSSNEIVPSPLANENILVIRTDLNGNILWRNQYGGAGRDVAYNVEIIDNGRNFVITGAMDEAYNSGGILKGGKVFLLKLTGTGAIMWCAKYAVNNPNTPGIERYAGYAIQEMNDGSLVVAGTCDHDATGADIRSPYVIRTRNNGVLIWAHIYTGQSVNTWDIAKGVRQTNDGEIVVSGMANSFTGNADMFLMKLNLAFGNVMWARRYDAVDQSGNSFSEYGFDFHEANNGDLVIVGTTDYTLGENAPSVFLTRTTSIGTTLWSKRYPNYSVGYSALYAIAADVHAAGTSMDIVNGGEDGFVVASDPLIPGGLFVVKSDMNGASDCSRNVNLKDYACWFNRVAWDSRSEDCALYVNQGNADIYEPDTYACTTLPKSGTDSETGYNGEATIAPNPAFSGADAGVNFTLANEAKVAVQFTDLIGTELFTTQAVYGTGQHTIALPTQKLAPGVYMAHITIDGVRTTQKLVIIR